MAANVYRMDGTGSESQIMWFSIAMSMICHLFFFTALIVVPKIEPKSTFSPPAINVSIVTLPNTPDLKTRNRDIPLSNVRVESTPDVSAKTIAPSTTVQEKTATSYKPKVSLKKKTFRTEKVLKQAIAEIEKKVEESEPDPVVKAIERLKDAMGQSESPETANRMLPPGEGLNATSRKALDIMDIYKAEIPFRIQKNWAFSEQLAGGRRDLVAWLVIEILPDGEIRDIWFEKRSGNRYFDDQAYKAVKKSNPLPSLPEGYTRPFFNVGLRFTPSGLK